MEKILTDGTRIYYEIHGDTKNKTLIFLHGNMEDSSFFKQQLEYFAISHQVIVLDTRGHGKSDWGSYGRANRYNLRLLADDLRELVLCLELDNFIVVGFSDGANVAMEFASLGVTGLKGLVLIGGNLRPWGMKIGTILEIIKDYIFSFGKRDGFNRRRKLGLMLFEPRISRSSLTDIQAPTLVLAGDNDLIRKRETLKIGRLIRGSKVEFIKDADHFFIYNNGDIFNKMLEQWLNSV